MAMSIFRNVTVCFLLIALIAEAMQFSSEPLRANLGTPPITEIYAIDASMDDAWTKADDVKWDDASYYLSKSDMRAGCRWRIDVPKGAIIESAHYVCRSRSTSEMGALCRIQVFAQDSCDDFDVIFWDWAAMSGAVDWILPDFTTDAWYASPDLKEIVQAYIDRSNYASGNYLGLKLWWQLGLQPGHEVWAFDGDADSAARLMITYTTESPVSNLLAFAEAPNFARLDIRDPCGWFYHAVLYNPTNADIIVTGLRWWYRSDVEVIRDLRDATCYDTRYFSAPPITSGVADAAPSWTSWSYPAGDISINVPAKGIIVTWIEVPTRSENGYYNQPATYYVEAYDGSQWISSPIYDSYGGDDAAVSTIFRADFDLATSPDGENQTHPNPQWLFNENRTTVAETTRRVRLIPIASGKEGNAEGINYATINITFPLFWSYAPSSSYNPYSENITYYSVDSKDKLQWDLNNDVLVHYLNQSMAQNYIEFNVTAPSTPGIYNFTINSSVTALGGRTIEENQFIYVNVKSPPKAYFTHSPETPIINQTVTFNASSSYDSDGTIVSYDWNFGDGTNGTDAVTTHNYTSTGTYNVTLTVNDNEGLVDSESKLITVIKYPVASFTYSPTTPLVDETVTFNASESKPNGGTIISYAWDFENDSVTDAYGTVVYHNYTTAGTYIVTLNITDSEGLWDFDSKSVAVRQYPIAFFTFSPESPLVGEAVTFNGSLSSPNGGSIVSYYWDFGDGSNGTGVTNSHIYIAEGNYTASLTIIDSEDLSDTEYKFVKIGKTPVAVFTYSPEVLIVNQSVTFNASSSYDPDGTIISYEWNFGDGTNGTNAIINHTYTSFGTYNVTLTVVDDDGHNSSTLLLLTVHIHDLAIFDITTSTTQVNVNQIVNVTVVVKNEGTINENFVITLYYDGTVIETRNVTDLAPDMERAIVFSWNTEGVTYEVNYTISAEIGPVLGETDTSDNTYTDGIVRVINPIVPPFDWEPIIPYLLSGVLAGLTFFAVGLLWKKSEKPPKSTGFDLFNTITDGGIPNAYSVMIIGGASSGKSIFCQQLTYNYLKQGDACIYVTYDTFPNAIRETMRTFNWDTSVYEKDGRFKFIDCYSSIASVSSQEEYYVEQPFALSDLGITMSGVMNAMHEKSIRVFLDSTVPIFSRLDSQQVTRFLQDRSAKIKGENGIFFFTVGEGTVPPNLMRRLEEIVDGIIELDVHEREGKVLRRLRIKKLRGRSFISTWIPYSIETERGVTFSNSKRWLKRKT